MHVRHNLRRFVCKIIIIIKPFEEVLYISCELRYPSDLLENTNSEPGHETRGSKFVELSSLFIAQGLVTIRIVHCDLVKLSVSQYYLLFYVSQIVSSYILQKLATE